MRTLKSLLHATTLWKCRSSRRTSTSQNEVKPITQNSSTNRDNNINTTGTQTPPNIYLNYNDKTPKLNLAMGQKEKPWGGFGLFFLLPIRFFRYPFLTHSHLWTQDVPTVARTSRSPTLITMPRVPPRHVKMSFAHQSFIPFQKLGMFWSRPVWTTQ